MNQPMPPRPHDDDLQDLPLVPGELLAALPPSAIRRWITLVLLVIFAMALSVIGAELPAERQLAKVLSFTASALAVLQAVLMWRATANAIVLSEDELRESATGRLIARLDDIERVDTTAFAYRPATGFLIFLRSPAPFAVAPGMWWRAGRRIGIGGVTTKTEGKIMAAALRAAIETRKAR